MLHGTVQCILMNCVPGIVSAICRTHIQAEEEDKEEAPNEACILHPKLHQSKVGLGSNGQRTPAPRDRIAAIDRAVHTDELKPCAITSFRGLDLLVLGAQTQVLRLMMCNY